MRMTSSFLVPKQIKTNTATDMLKLIAYVAMVIDHCGKLFFPQYPVMRQIGRLAYPLFAYCVAVGAVYTSSPLKYASRLSLLALVSQPLYAIALKHESAAMYSYSFSSSPLQAVWAFYIGSWQKPSILFSLLLGLGIILLIRNKQLPTAVVLYILCERFSVSLDYGINGIRFMLLSYLLLEHSLLFAVSTISLWIWWACQGSGYTLFGHTFGIQIYAIPAVLLTILPMKGVIKLPKWFTYGFYPAHLIAIITWTYFH